MAKQFALEMVTPERVVYSKEVAGIVVPAHEGYLGVLAGHAPLLCTLQPGEITLQTDDGEKYLATSGGFLEVTPEKTILLSEAVEFVDELNLERAKQALDRAKKRLSERLPDMDRDRAVTALKRAENRLKLAKKRSTGAIAPSA